MNHNTYVTFPQLRFDNWKGDIFKENHDSEKCHTFEIFFIDSKHVSDRQIKNHPIWVKTIESFKRILFQCYKVFETSY